MKNIGITGQSGFIGTHLTLRINQLKDQYCLIPFKDDYFNDADALKEFLLKCDVVVHLAAVNRHSDQEYLYRKNIELAEKLIWAMKSANIKPHIIYSSSIQEEQNNIYGSAKKEVRMKLEKFSEENGNLYTPLIIPNVFGPFSTPFYNTVIATFSQQLINDQPVSIIVDSFVKLIYVEELTSEIINIIKAGPLFNGKLLNIEHTKEIKVSELLIIMQRFKNEYIENGVMPELQNRFEINLFNTFRSFINMDKYFPRKFKLNIDGRGSFVEILKSGSPGQTSYSITNPGIIRGNHYHTRKIERFAVIKGEAVIEMRRINSQTKHSFRLSGKEPAYIDIPVWYTHSIQNISNEELVTIFWINEFYNPDDPDTYFESV